MRFLLPVLFALPGLAHAQVVVDTEGECGGPISITATGLTPRGTVFAVASPDLGDAVIPGGDCAGTSLGLADASSHVRIRANADGTLAMSPTLPEEMCDHQLVFVDTASCEVSAPVSITPATRDITFNVDMSCAGVDFSTVHVTGPWAGWSPDFVLSDPDGDMIYSTTLTFDAGATVEYKFMVDGWAAQEDLVDDMLAGGDCAPITDYFSYANRLEVLEDDVVTDDVYGTCGVCGDGGPVDVTFEVDMNCLEEPPASVGLPGPDVGWDFWARTLTDDDGDGIWTGTFSFDDAAMVEYTVAINDWAGQEDLIDEMVDGAECAPVTDYFSYANRLITASEGLVVSSIYDTCGDACPDADPGGGPTDVTFNVDMRCSGLSPYAVALPGPDVGWDFWARALSDDDGDGIWSGTFSFDEGAMVEYTIALDEWAMQEDLVDDMVDGGECAPVTDYYSYANRQITVSPDMMVDDTYDTCDACVL